MIFCTFAARHALPNSPKPLYEVAERYEIGAMQNYRTDYFAEAIRLLQNNQTIKVYVTGFTPALIDFYNATIAYNNQIIFLHYDRDSDSYVEQKNNLVSTGNLALKLRTARLSNGFDNKKAFASLLGVSEPTLYKIEDPLCIGKVSFETISRYAKLVGLSIYCG